MYSVILNNGTTINIYADSVEWLEKERMIRFLHDNNVVARINMDSIVGWAETNHIIGSDSRNGISIIDENAKIL